MWSADEARRFLEGVADDRLVGLWTLALHTGLRRGELAGLRWRDVDLEAGTLTVAQQRTTANHQVVLTKAKSQRQLLLAPATVAALRAHLKRQREERLALGPHRTDSGFVLVDEAGVEYHPHRFTKMVEDAVKRTAVPKIRLHDTRHTMASLALACSAGDAPRRDHVRPTTRDALLMNDLYAIAVALGFVPRPGVAAARNTATRRVEIAREDNGLHLADRRRRDPRFGEP